MRNNFSVVLLLVIFLTSCLENPSLITPLEFNDDSQASLLLSYIENTGAFRQNSGTVKLVGAYAVYSAPNNYDIIDIRSNIEYLSGHIAGAVHVEITDVMNYLSTLETSSLKQKLIVSRNGFIAAYINCLANLYGITNVCILQYGMAGWNTDLSDDWITNIHTYSESPDYKLISLSYPAFEHSAIPQINGLGGTTVQEKLKYRISQLISELQIDDIQINSPAAEFFRFEDLYDYYDSANESFNGLFILCYGDINIYKIYGTSNHLFPAHPPQTRIIEPPVKTNPQSDSYIQTIPSGEIVLVYSSDGFDSAYLTAFLRVLGYNAKSMLYGANTFAWNGLRGSTDTEARLRAFIPGNVLNLPYVMGEQP